MFSFLFLNKTTDEVGSSYPQHLELTYQRSVPTWQVGLWGTSRWQRGLADLASQDDVRTFICFDFGGTRTCGTSWKYSSAVAQYHGLVPDTVSCVAFCSMLLDPQESRAGAGLFSSTFVRPPVGGQSEKKDSQSEECETESRFPSRLISAGTGKSYPVRLLRAESFSTIWSNIALTLDTVIYTADDNFTSNFTLSNPTHTTFQRQVSLKLEPAETTKPLKGSILKKLLEVRLEPSPSLRRRGQRVRISAVSIIASSARVASPIALSTRLDPHNGINKRIARVSRGQAAEARALDVAPVAPLQLRRRLHAAAALVHDEVRAPPVLRQQRRDRVDVQLLVVVLVALRVGRGGRGVVAVVVGDVGHEAAQRLGLAGVGPDLREEFGCGREVGVPA